MNVRGLLGVMVVCGVLACDRKPDPEPKDAGLSASKDAPLRASLESVPIAAAGSALVDDAACSSAAGNERPTVRWAKDTSFHADMNYDKAPDLVVWGTEGDSVFVVSIIECAEGRPGRIWNVPLRRAVWGTLDIEVSLVNPAFGRGYLEENCMGAESTPECQQLAALETRLEAAYEAGGRGLQIGVPDRHNLHVYWDSDSTKFIMWGL